MDIMMPLMDGLTAARYLQSLNPQVKIVIASGLVSSERAAQIAELGIQAFLAKPYTAQALLETIKQVLLGS